MRVVVGGDDGTLAVSEADGVPVALTDSFEVDRVTVEEELSLFTVRESNRLFATPAELKHGPVGRLFGTRDGAGPEEVTDTHVAAGHGVVSDGLGNGVVQVLHVARGDLVPVLKSGGLDVDL